jgi:hypothetical protein
MDSERERPSCTDQFDRQQKPELSQDRWIDDFFKRLRILLDRVAGKK